MTGPELSPELLDKLIDAGNKAVNDYYHERTCACRDWPASCASATKPTDMFFGFFDTNAFAIGLPDIIATYLKETRC